MHWVREKKKKVLDLAGLRKKSQPHVSSLLILLWKGLTCREGGKAALSFITRTSSYLVFGDKQCIWRPLRSSSSAALCFGMTAWAWHSWTKKPFHSPSYKSLRGFSFLSVPPAIYIKLFFATGAQCWVTEHSGVTLLVTQQPLWILLIKQAPNGGKCAGKLSRTGFLTASQ